MRLPEGYFFNAVLNIKINFRIYNFHIYKPLYKIWFLK